MWKKICLNITAFLWAFTNCNFPLETQLKNKVVAWSKIMQQQVEIYNRNVICLIEIWMFQAFENTRFSTINPWFDLIIISNYSTGISPKKFQSLINQVSSFSFSYKKYSKSVYWGFRRSFGARSKDTRSLATRLKPNSAILFWTADFKLLSSTTSSPYSPAPWRLKIIKEY